MNHEWSEDCRTVVECLGRLLSRDMRSLASEQRSPGGDPDLSDDDVKELKRRVEALQGIRRQFEVVMTGVIL